MSTFRRLLDYSPLSTSIHGRVVRSLMLLAGLLLLGALGFVLVEGWSFFDGLYMAVISLTTVGFQEVHPLSPAGRAFVMAYLALGLGVFLYGLTQWGELVVRSQVGLWWEQRKMVEQLHRARDHFIICGFGRMGRTVSRDLAGKGLPLVVVDRDESVLAECRTCGWPVVVGDATDDQVLVQAGIQRARGLAAALSSDADVLFVVMSARLLAKQLQIVARASDEKSVAKLIKAGANRVISLYETGGLRMAELLTNPRLDDIVEVLAVRGAPLDLAEMQIPLGSPLVGQRLEQTNLRQQGLLVVGIRRTDGALVLPAVGETEVQAGDTLITLGRLPAIEHVLSGPAFSAKPGQE